MIQMITGTLTLGKEAVILFNFLGRPLSKLLGQDCVFGVDGSGIRKRYPFGAEGGEDLQGHPFSPPQLAFSFPCLLVKWECY